MDDGQTASASEQENRLSEAAMPGTGTKVIGILVADDHPLLREGIAALISKQTDMQLLGEAANGREALEKFRLLRPDVTLMDVQMPDMNGIDALIAIRSECPSAKVIVLTTYAGDALAQRALMAGALAYVLKGSVRKELVDAIRDVYRGRKRVEPEVARELVQHMGEDVLSAREVEVLTLIAGGNSNKQIAATLSITEETAKAHVKSIIGKLEAKDRTHAVTLALTRGIIQLPNQRG
jgi:DNA-binding NarL/FixJ family response regulator